MYFAIYKKMENEKETEINKALNEIDKGRHEEVKPVDEPVKEVVKEGHPEIPDLTKYEQVLKKVDYTKPSSEKVTYMTDVINEESAALTAAAQERVGKPKSSKKVKVPKKVTQDEFDSTDENERRTLYYYSDGILADDEDETYDPIETIGATNFKNFKATYDPIYIFNYATEFMYEIIPSNSKYSDIVGGDIRR